MDWSLDLLISISQWIRPYLTEVSLAITATLLVVFGGDITNMLRKQISTLHFFLRMTVFVLFCAFGFGFMAAFLTPILASKMASMSNVWLAPSVVAIFYAIGFIAQKKRLL